MLAYLRKAILTNWDTTILGLCVAAQILLASDVNLHDPRTWIAIITAIVGGGITSGVRRGNK